MIGENIKRRRLQLGLSQLQLAQRMGYKTKSSITHIEKDHVDLPLKKVQQLADALECSPAVLMGWEQENRERLYYEKIGELFKQLDETDQARIEERMIEMLEGEKYHEAP